MESTYPYPQKCVSGIAKIKQGTNAFITFIM